MQSSVASPQLALRDYLHALRRRRVAVLVTAGVAVAITLGLTGFQPKKYEATAELLLQQRSTESLFNTAAGQQATDRTRALQTEIRVLQSPVVKVLVEAQLVGHVPDVKGRPIGQTDVVAVRVVSGNPKVAADAANAYAAAYIDHRRTQAVDDLFQAGQKIQDKLAELQAKIDAAPPGQRASLEQNRTFFENERDKLQLTAELTSGGAAIVRPATVPGGAFSPTPVRNALIALVLGLMLGVGIAFFLEYLDDSVRTKEELERAGHGVPVLGLIPSVPGWRDRAEARLVSLTEPSSPPAEAYRTLRTAVQFVGLDRDGGMIQVTSAGASEGKSTTVANLAVALARGGHHVVIVGCDLRRPRVHEFFGLANDVGFTSVLLGESSLSGALQSVPGFERLQLLASGPLPPNPSELLSIRRTLETLAPLRDGGRFVLIDSPPVLPVTDALVIARWVDATLLVCSSSTTNRKNVARAVELLRQVDAPVVGTVLNGVEPGSGYQDGDYYGGSGYGHDPAAGRAAADANGHRQGPRVRKPARRV